MNRRDFYRYGTIALGNLVALALAVPGVAYLLDPLRRKSKQGDFQELATLSQLQPGVPKSVSILEERQDAWVKYPREPIGSIWLIRQPACAKGGQAQVLALSAECPHLGCAVNLGADGKSFFCPCHTSSFDLCGQVTNRIPPRAMDELEVKLTKDPDPKVLVKFQRFRAQAVEKIPLV
jgi:menaquinol-cytochrome c reductase iron-sulfur subunit